MSRFHPRRISTSALLAALIVAAPGLGFAQPPAGDPASDLLRRDAPAQSATPSNSQAWNPAWDEPARPADDGEWDAERAADPEVSVTQRLNAGVLETDQAIVASNAEAEARWRAEVATAEDISTTEQTAYQRALEEHQRAVAQQQADYDGQMRAWQAQADACRRGVRQACVTWHRE